jgi:hypothetical protein
MGPATPFGMVLEDLATIDVKTPEFDRLLSHGKQTCLATSPATPDPTVFPRMQIDLGLSWPTTQL